jgi:uncharacterized protein YdeI (YjbR/CyaY-like superfamily)
MNPKVDAYLARSTLWPAEAAALRGVLLGCGLDEEFKWGKPCYAHGGANIAIIQEMKGFLALMFFKGALLRDPEGVLEEQGENSHSAKRITFRSVADVTAMAGTIAAYAAEAITVERSGVKVAPRPALVLVDALQDRIDADPEFRAAFESLTPGRQREYHLHVADAKQLSTRQARVDKQAERILAGKGLRDR